MSSADAAVDLPVRHVDPASNVAVDRGAVQRWGAPASRSSVWPTAAVRPSLISMANSWSMASAEGKLVARTRRVTPPPTSLIVTRVRETGRLGEGAVSYTHLTLPTKRIV